MGKNVVLSFLTAMLAAVSVSVGAVLILSLIVMAADIAELFITLINYVIKLAALTLGVFTFAKGDKGIIKGAVFGIVYALITAVVFAIISGKFSFDLKFFADALYCVATGAVLGILAVNAKKNQIDA